MQPFELIRPRSLAEASRAFTGNAAYLAGGHTLIPAMKARLQPVERLIDLSGITGLSDIRIDESRLHIGAMARHQQVADSPLIQHQLPALSALAASIGDPAVRQLGTMGGSVALNDAAADYPCALLALDGVIETSHGSHGADDFFLGAGQTALADGELVTSVSVPIPDSAAYEKQRHPTSRFPLAAVFVARFGQNFRVAVTGATSFTQRWSQAEKALELGSPLEKMRLESPHLAQDPHASAEYRAHLCGVMLRRAVARLS